MIRLIPVAIVLALLITGCASPAPGSGSTYGSASQQQRMEQDTTMGAGGGSGGDWNAGQGYKGGNGLNDGKTAAKF